MAAERNAALVGKLRPSALLTLPRALPPAWERSGRCARLCYRRTTQRRRLQNVWTQEEQKEERPPQ